MAWQRLASRYGEFAGLMDQGTAAIEREDAGALESLSQDAARLLREIQTDWTEVEAAARRTGRADEPGLETLRQAMREALTRSDDNQKRIAAWQGRTRDALCAVVQGGAAMAGYGRPAVNEAGLMSRTA